MNLLTKLRKMLNLTHVKIRKNAPRNWSVFFAHDLLFNYKNGLEKK